MVSSLPRQKTEKASSRTNTAADLHPCKGMARRYTLRAFDGFTGSSVHRRLSDVFLWFPSFLSELFKPYGS